MSEFRSQEMAAVQLFIQHDSAKETLVEIGELGCVQFKDLNEDKTAFQRTYANEVRKCDEMEKSLRFLQDQVKKIGVQSHGIQGSGNSINLSDLAVKLEDTEKELQQLNASNEGLERSHAEFTEHKHVLERCSQFLVREQRPRLGGNSSSVEMENVRLMEEGGSSQRLGYIAGCIQSDKMDTFSRVLFRATRGNMYLRSEALSNVIVDPKSMEKIHKTVFVCFYSGERAMQKIKKIADSFGAMRYDVPESMNEHDQLVSDLDKELTDLDQVIERTHDRRHMMLGTISLSLDGWAAMVLKEKAVYAAMNMFSVDASAKCLVAEAWVPKCDLERVEGALRRGAHVAGTGVGSVMNVIASRDTPPTYFKTNKFTQGFQAIVDSYGMAKYQEYNPAVFTVVTFPFLFGVMFGDAGHGTIMTAVAVYMIMKEQKLARKKLNEMVETVFKGRYLILLMGIFAFYTGCIYNETFAIPMKAAPSQWEHPPANSTQKQLVENVVYPFGVDPGWAHTMNKLNFFNSLKMKMSIILGVTQMSAGVFCKFFNSIFFKDMLELKFVFIPEIIFLNSLFGYLCILIFTKWGTNFNERFVLNNDVVLSIPSSDWVDGQAVWKGSVNGVERTITEDNAFYKPEVMDVKMFNPGSCKDAITGCSLWKQKPPSLLDTLIQMFMSVGTVLPENRLFEGQGAVQVFLLLVAFACVPVLLLAKPMILKKQHENKMSYATMDDDQDEDAAPGKAGHGDEPFEFGEIMVHQIIHTIEYVLGAISNTASYLRLWALSLAHAQLSEVFWEQVVVGIGLDMFNASPVMMVVTVTVWACLTFAVLMLMESLSAFLHALRLHWVEFQGKFYSGTGVKFMPFNFKQEIIED